MTAPRPHLRALVRAQQPPDPGCCHQVATCAGKDPAGNYLVVPAVGGDPIAAPTCGPMTIAAGQAVFVHRGPQGSLLILGPILGLA